MRRSRPAVLGMALALALGGGLGGTALGPPAATASAAASERSLPASAAVQQVGDDAIVQHYEQLGGGASFLGAPVGSPYDIAGGRAQNYAGGTIYWSPATGAHETHGSIGGHYLELGGPAGFLGFPLTDETGTPDGVGRFNHFAGGSMYWSPATGAHEVHGAIRAQWTALGWEHSRLGYPTSDEYGITGGRRSDFQHGSILWHEASSRIEVIYTSIPSALLGVDLERIPTTQKVVALTFDAGANDAGLRSILATLAANGVPGTFFLTGDWVSQFPSDPAL